MASVWFGEGLFEATKQHVEGAHLSHREKFHPCDAAYWSLHRVQNLRPQIRRCILIELLSYRQELRLELRQPVHLDYKLSLYLENCFWSRKGVSEEYIRLQEQKFLSPRVRSLVKLVPREEARGQELIALPLKKLTATLRMLQTQEDVDDKRISDDRMVRRTFMRVLAANEWKDDVDMVHFNTKFQGGMPYKRPEPDPMTRHRYPKRMIEGRRRTRRAYKSLGIIRKIDIRRMRDPFTNRVLDNYWE